jgi:hypothetical protein
MLSWLQGKSVVLQGRSRSEVTSAYARAGAGSGASYSFWYTSRNAASPNFALHQ